MNGPKPKLDMRDPLVIGTLTLKVVEGKLIRNTEMFGKMDPFVQIDYRINKFKTKVNDSGGVTPKWNEIFKIPVYSIDDILKMTCKDQDLIIDDIIGET